MDKKVISFLSQWRVIIPLSVVVLVWFVWPQPKPERVIKPTVPQNTSPDVATTKRKTDIISLFGTNKKLSCKIESAVAVIDDTKLSATLNNDTKKNRVIFDGDCLYRWTDDSSSGERICGLKTYLPLLSQFVTSDSLQKLFPQSNELASACKEVSIVDQKVFEVPKTVLFKNKKLL